MNKKLIIVVSILFVIILSVAAFILLQDPVERCVKKTKSDLKKHKTQYLSGAIIVNFKEAITKETARQIIESYNLSVDYQYPNQNSALIKVPKDKEIEAMCMLKKDSRIASTELNVIFNEINR